MSSSARFCQGMKAAVPIWIAFVPSSLAWGIAAQAHGLTLAEVILMSAWVYSGSVQFAILAPLGEGKSALQVFVAGFLMNLRFLPMSAALAPFFRGVKRLPLIFSSHFISASSFIVPYLQFHKEKADAARAANDGRLDGDGNLAFFLGVGATSFTVWLSGSAAGFTAALGFPQGIEEALKFILPGYFAGLLVAEMKGRTMAALCSLSLVLAIPGALVSPGWGWIVTATVVATTGWGIEEWRSHASKSS
jgi:predicted branched-subunit amino acid permease